ncbi:MAG: HD-GYP domain-containing protein [Chloroflexota bacterium]
MGRLPLRARAYLLFVLACAVLLLLEANPISNPPAWEVVILCLVLGLGSVLADTHLVELTHTTKVSVSAALDFALLLLVGPGMAAWTIALSAALTTRWHLQRAWRWYNVAFYAANGVLSVGAAGLVYQGISGGAPLLSSGAGALALLLAGATYFFLNVGTVAAIVALARNSDSASDFLSAFKAAAPQFAGLLVLGLVGAEVYSASPAAAALLLIPVVGVYASLRSALTLRAETKRAIEALALEVDQYHPYTSQHSERVARYAARVAQGLQLSQEQVDTISRAAQIHDLGKLSIWPGMLNKLEGLTEEERRELRCHPARGAELVSRFPDYRNGKDLILHHHERYDGHGYPNGLKGDEIPLGARIIAVADAVDAMLSDRPYRKALSLEDTMRELERNRGGQFDPMVADVMLDILEGEGRLGTWRGLSPMPATL